MPSTFIPAPGAAGFQLSNPSVLDVISLYSSLELFKQAGKIGSAGDAEESTEEVKQARILAPLRAKSLNLTNYLEALLTLSPFFSTTSTSSSPISFTIITPSDPTARGAQLSLLFSPAEVMLPIFDSLREGGVLGDERKPGVIRLAPVPMYNTFEDVRRAADVLEKALEKESKKLVLQ
jgi:kynureninase